ncbi:MAG: hypothetical protein M1470_14810 [Bacteroidetes bacterium]|nr:hypothetical protein [Bacteroidota bacterium]MCL5737940.1 hypothetical protein [Bacteroidota bacterium]
MKIRGIVFLAATCGTLSGCVPVYVPNTIDAPLLRNAGEVRIAGNAGTTGLDVQSAVAVSDAIAIMANGSFGSKSTSDSLDYNVHNYLEAGLGYYMPITKGSSFEMFVGAGSGKATSSDAWRGTPSSQLLATGWYNRYFLQMDVGAYNEFASGGFAMRASYVHFRRIEGGSGYVSTNLDGLFAEPVLFASLGGPLIRFTGQMGVSFPLSDHIRFQWMPFILNFGVEININRK